MVKREFDKSRYVVVGIITFLVFLLGLTLGIVIDNARVSSVERLSKTQEVDFKAIQFQYLYMSTLEKTNVSCDVLRIALEKSVGDLAKSLQKVSSYKDKTTPVNTKEMELIERNYLQDNLKYWLFAQETKNACDLDFVTILYFYSDDHCSICPDQGVILTYYKELLQDTLLVFPINVDLEGSDAIIAILKTRYNVTTLPTLVIEDKTYPGVVQKDELEPLICQGYKDNTTCYK